MYSIPRIGHHVKNCYVRARSWTYYQSRITPSTKLKVNYLYDSQKAQYCRIN